MINFFKKVEQKPNQLHSITFRVTLEDKNKLLRQATGLKISLSEYVRNKAMIDERELQERLDENDNFKKENEELKNQLKTTLSSNNEENIIKLNFSEESVQLIKTILSFTRWNRFETQTKRIENDFELSKAIVFILVEYLTQPLEDMRGLRSKYNIITFEDLFNTLAKVYME